MQLINVFWKNCGIEEVLDALNSEIGALDDDFNGKNGADVSEMFLINDCIKKQDMEERLSIDSIVSQYLSAYFSDTVYYANWTYEMMEHPAFGIIGVSVSWIRR